MTFRSVSSVHLCFTWFYFTFVRDSRLFFFVVGALLALHFAICDCIAFYAIFSFFALSSFISIAYLCFHARYLRDLCFAFCFLTHTHSHIQHVNNTMSYRKKLGHPFLSLSITLSQLFIHFCFRSNLQSLRDFHLISNFLICKLQSNRTILRAAVICIAAYELLFVVRDVYLKFHFDYRSQTECSLLFVLCIHSFKYFRELNFTWPTSLFTILALCCFVWLVILVYFFLSR